MHSGDVSHFFFLFIYKSAKVRQNYFPFEDLSAVYIKQWEEVEKVLSNKAEKSQKRKKTEKEDSNGELLK